MRASVICAICQEVMHDPYRTDCCCGKSFCKTCLERWLKKNPSCPLCKSAATVNSMTACCRQWKEAVDSVKRACPNSAECRFRMAPFAATTTHAVKECSFRLEACSNEGCGQMILHKNKKEHVRLCKLKRCRNYRPPRYGCQQMGTQKEIEQHELKCQVPQEILKQIDELLKKKGKRCRSPAKSQPQQQAQRRP